MFLYYSPIIRFSAIEEDEVVIMVVSSLGSRLEVCIIGTSLRGHGVAR